MSFVRKPLDRRSVLRGMGAMLALPLLEGMLPTANAADIDARPKRLGIFYTPNGMSMDSFTPSTLGLKYELSPILQPLEASRDKFSVITGLAHYNAGALGDGPGSHGRSCGTYLTGAHPKRTEGSDLRCGISMDQVVANALANETQLASLELGIEPPSLLGSCDIGYSCTYTNTLSWRNESVALPVMVNPHEVFERLFGDGNLLDENARQALLKRKSSILDFVLEDAKRLSTKLGMNDKRKMDEYLHSIRDVERRIQKASQQTIQYDTTEFRLPAGIPADFIEHVKLMIDLQVLALQTDMTRVSSFMLGRELSNRSYPEVGVPDSHHMLSHHGGDKAKIAKLVRISQMHMGLFAYYLERMNSTKDGVGSLLDNTIVMAGASLGEPNEHDHMNLPLLVAGHGIQGNNHVQLPKNTPMSNFMLSLINQMNVGITQFGDSTEALDLQALRV